MTRLPRLSALGAPTWSALVLAVACFGGACRQGSAPIPGTGPGATTGGESAAPAAQAVASAAPGDCRRQLVAPKYPDNPTAPAEQTFGPGYEFTEDWFTRNVPVWKEHLGPLRGAPNLRYLEVGTFEGMSALWMLQNVLTAASALAEGVDPYFEDQYKLRAEKNFAHSGHGAKFKLHRGLSADVLPRLAPASYDVIYIDGSHTADDVLADAVLCWLLVKPGGLIVFDDWQFDPALPEELRPGAAIDAFITAYRRRLTLVHRGYQVIVKKDPFGGCNANPFCTPVGDRGYDFQQHRLFNDDGTVVELSDPERQLLESLLVGRRFGAARTELEPADLERLGRPALEALAPKVGLKLP